MNGIGAGDLRRRDDAGDVQIALTRESRPDADVVIGIAYVKRIAVCFRVNGDGLETELFAGDDDAKRNLAAVGDENLIEHLNGSHANGEELLAVFDGLSVLRIDLDRKSVV